MTIATIQKLIDHSREPRIEIGGPTPEGYLFLAALGLRLPDHFTVTNKANPIVLNPYGDAAAEYLIDEVVDIRTLPYDANSVGMFLTSSFPLYDGDSQVCKHVALDEYENIDALNGELTQLHNLHIVLLRQAVRTLRPGGLIVIENTWQQDTTIALKLGFRPLLTKAIEQRLHGQIYQKL